LNGTTTTNEAQIEGPDPVARLAELVCRYGGMFVLTGAGCSTASGIPDYRDSDGRWKVQRPTLFQEFRTSARVRKRYWARSFSGWPRVAAAEPNRAHLALRALEDGGLVRQLVTQNVDGLHQRAGSKRVIDLHGRLSRVDCLDCGLWLRRSDMQERLAAANPCLLPMAATFAPDGDAILEAELLAGFRVPDCPRCGGILKPAVVFFGENVPRPRVARACAGLQGSRAVLVVGSSLSVYSGFRFCREAAALDIPIVLVNRGRTRADDLAAVKVAGDAGAVLAELVRRVHDRAGGSGQRSTG
jgi:NAD-dependent SIR2 family protein deacetylase